MDVGAGQVTLEGAVDERVGAELLDDVDLDGERVLVRLRGDLEGLGAEADRDLALVGLGDLGDDLAVERDARRADLGCTVVHGEGREVHGGGADEAGDEHVGRGVVHVARRADLLQEAVLEDRDAVTHGEGLGLVVRDVDGRDAEAALERRDLRTGLDTELGVEVRQRLVHEEDLRLADDRAAHGDTLALTTREGLRLAVQVLGQVEDLRSLLDALADVRLGRAGDLQREAHVVRDGHVRVQRVVLEDHRDVAVLGLHVGDVAVTDEDVPAVDVLEAREHAERGRLATTRGADEDEELAVLDVQVELVHRRALGPRVEPRCVVESDRSHDGYIPPPAGTCRTIRCVVTCRAFTWCVSAVTQKKPNLQGFRSPGDLGVRRHRCSASYPRPLSSPSHPGHVRVTVLRLPAGRRAP
ncbi:hypothetical protein D3C74_311510 [compost metagenome]